ncbi:MAG: hypothetical protein ABI678_19100, partial [Kofleriaceae bacterium]
GTVLALERDRAVLQIGSVLRDGAEIVGLFNMIEPLLSPDCTLIVDDGSPAGETRNPALIAYLTPRVGQIVLEPCPSLLP